MRLFRNAVKAASFVLAIVVLAAFPVLLEVRDGHIALTLRRALTVIANWSMGMFDGSAWSFNHGATVWSFFEVVPKFAGVTFIYLVLPGIAGLTAGFFLGLLRDPAGKSPARGFLAAVLNTIFAIPDFILAVLLQVFVVMLLDITGIKMFSVTHDTRSGLLLALPLFVMTVYPFIYSYRMVQRTASRVNGSYFVLNAKARGVSSPSIRYKHIGASVLSSLATDLPTVMSIMMTSIFVVEYSFALPGLTRWLFTVAFSGTRVGWFNSYQYPLAVNILFCIAATYFLTLLTFKGLLAGIRKAMIHAL